jgi:hypothetical protein
LLLVVAVVAGFVVAKPEQAKPYIDELVLQVERLQAKAMAAVRDLQK